MKHNFDQLWIELSDELVMTINISITVINKFYFTPVFHTNYIYFLHQEVEVACATLPSRSCYIVATSKQSIADLAHMCEIFQFVSHCME